MIRSVLTDRFTMVLVFQQIVLVLGLAFFVGVSCDDEQPRAPSRKRIPKQISHGLVLDEDDEDRKAEGTGFENFGGFGGGGGGGGEGGGKYFMYQHVPKKDHYEFGFKRGNEHHWKERHEKGHPHVGHFKTKVKWGDKHGGQGEHYWDYNHHGHHGDDGGGSSGDDADEASETVKTNAYEPTRTTKTGVDERLKRDQGKMSEEETKTQAQQLLSSAVAVSQSQFSPEEGVIPNLAYNLKDGTVIDQNNGKVYLLFPVAE